MHQWLAGWRRRLQSVFGRTAAAVAPSPFAPTPVAFVNPGRLVDGDLTLALTACYPGDRVLAYEPAYRFEMRHTTGRYALGTIELRLANTPDIVLYVGHIGYGVHEAQRGHHYAARSCRLLLPLARHHGLDPLWITCNPDNWPSRRTCEWLGAELVEIIDIPPTHEMYLEGERQKCRYRLDLHT